MSTVLREHAEQQYAEELDALAERPGEVSFVQADVSSREDCRRMAAITQERLGGIDVLCANAGIFPESRLADLTEETLDQVLGTNLKGTVLSVQACLSALALSGRGRVILISSIAGPITNTAVAVSNGLFTTVIDFGDAFDNVRDLLAEFFANIDHRDRSVFDGIMEQAGGHGNRVHFHFCKHQRDF